jgi:hypothetical protein
MPMQIVASYSGNHTETDLLGKPVKVLARKESFVHFDTVRKIFVVTWTVNGRLSGVSFEDALQVNAIKFAKDML